MEIRPNPRSQIFSEQNCHTIHTDKLHEKLICSEKIEQLHLINHNVYKMCSISYKSITLISNAKKKVDSHLTVNLLYLILA